MTTIKEHLAVMRTDIKYIREGMDKIELVNRDQDVAISQVKNDVSNIKGQATILGLAAGLLVSFVAWLISKFGGK